MPGRLLEAGDQDRRGRPDRRRGRRERFFVLRTFTVFSADQVEGEAAEQFQVHEEAGQPDAEPDFQPAEELIAATGADIRFGGDRAYYRRPTPAALPEPSGGDFIVHSAQGDLRPAGGVLRDRPARTGALGGSPHRLGPRQAGLCPGRTGGGDRLLLRLRRTRHPAGRGAGQPCRLPADLAGGVEERPELHLQGGKAGDPRSPTSCLASRRSPNPKQWGQCQ